MIETLTLLPFYLEFRGDDFIINPCPEFLVLIQPSRESIHIQTIYNNPEVFRPILGLRDVQLSR